MHSCHTGIRIEIGEAIDPGIHVFAVKLRKAECPNELRMERWPVGDFVATYRYSQTHHVPTINVYFSLVGRMTGKPKIHGINECAAIMNPYKMMGTQSGMRW